MKWPWQTGDDHTDAREAVQQAQQRLAQAREVAGAARTVRRENNLAAAVRRTMIRRTLRWQR